MRKTGIFFIAILAIACTSQKAYKDSISFSLNDFKYSQQITGEEVHFNNPIMKPIRIEVQDSLLFTINIGEDSLISIYGLKDRSFIGKRIQQGQGPNDMLQPSFANINKKEIQILDIATSKIYTFPLNDFITNKAVPYTHEIQLEEQIFSDVHFLGNKIISTAHGNKHPFYLFNDLGYEKKEWGEYPVLNKDYTDIENSEAFQCTFTTNLMNKIVICYSWTDLIEIYDKDGNLEKRLHGPEGFIPYFKETHTNNVKMAKPEKGKQRDAYYNPVSVGDQFFVLYNGKYVDTEDYSLLSNRILVFNWDGTPEQILHLDQGIFTFTVDPVSKTIYGISDNPDFHILKFTYQ